eukprot:1027258-Ditylum_brightwellii.AAC.1
MARMQQAQKRTQRYSTRTLTHQKMGISGKACMQKRRRETKRWHNVSIRRLQMNIVDPNILLHLECPFCCGSAIVSVPCVLGGADALLVFGVVPCPVLDATSSVVSMLVGFLTAVLLWPDDVPLWPDDAPLLKFVPTTMGS